jgi:hypothetical protein
MIKRPVGLPHSVLIFICFLIHFASSNQFRYSKDVTRTWHYSLQGYRRFIINMQIKRNIMKYASDLDFFIVCNVETRDNHYLLLSVQHKNPFWYGTHIKWEDMPISDINSQILQNHKVYSSLTTWSRLLRNFLVRRITLSLWNLRLHYHIYKTLLMGLILSHMNPVHIIKSCLRFILILSSHQCLHLPSDLFSSGFLTKILMYLLYSHACYIPYPSHLWFDHPDNICSLPISSSSIWSSW